MRKTCFSVIPVTRYVVNRSSSEDIGDGRVACSAGTYGEFSSERDATLVANALGAAERLADSEAGIVSEVEFPGPLPSQPMMLGQI